MRISVLVGVLVVAMGWMPAQNPPGQSSACIACHSNPDWVGEETQIVELFAGDVHAEVGLSCQDCHGGNADPSLEEDPEASMNRSFSRPFKGAPSPRDVPSFCGSCHSDAEKMKVFNPGLRVDQEQEYWTSQHGRALRQGDEKVATCVSCHGAHGIRKVSDPESPVYPSHVAETCHNCHSNAETMKGYTLPNGRPLGTQQYALWRQSVHARAMLERGDLSAPTCNDCHGNHGAVPPGLNSLVFVCGQCHGREAELFRQSPKIEAWRYHDEYLAEAGSDSCLACHEQDSPQAKMTHLTSFGECTVCHGNHGVIRPTVAMFAPLPETPCAFCHEGPGGLNLDVPEPDASRESYQALRDQLLEEARAAGLQGAAVFDWLVDKAQELPTHRVPDSAEGEIVLRPEFAELFKKFRIGKTAYQLETPDGADTIHLEVVRCTNCHSGDPSDGSASTGLLTGIDFLERMHELTALTARAERILLAARRGGVETRPGFLLVNKAVDTQIRLEALIHTFRVDGAFSEAHKEGMNYVAQALEFGQSAQVELRNRRVGLGVALIFILLFLVALGFKIRSLPPSGEGSRSS